MSIFKRKSKKEKLSELYAKLMEEAHQLSTVNRKLSDQKIADAEKIIVEIESLE